MLERGLKRKGEVMTDQEFRDLKELIEQKMAELEELQRKHINETGRRFVAPLRLGWPKK